MNKQVIAIGGGGFGRNPGLGIIEKYILDQSVKKNPKICFIPTATGDDESYKVSYYSTFSKLECKPTHLDFFKRTPNLEDLILSQDVIFVGGGNTKSMLSIWRDWGLHDILKEGYDNGIVMSGVSAGAICWFKGGITDSWADQLNIIECLGFIEGNCCPHYDEESERRPSLIKFLEEQKLKDCYAIEGGCALHIKNDFNYVSINFGNKKKCINISSENNELIKEYFKNYDCI